MIHIEFYPDHATLFLHQSRKVYVKLFDGSREIKTVNRLKCTSQLDILVGVGYFEITANKLGEHTVITKILYENNIYQGEFRMSITPFKAIPSTQEPTSLPNNTLAAEAKFIALETTTEPELRRLTDEEKQKITEDVRQESKVYRATKITWRNLRDNADVIVLFILIGIFFFAGYLYCRINLGMSHTQISTEVSHFIEIIFLLIVGIGASLLKLGMHKGRIAQSLNEQFELFDKDVKKTDLDRFGFTIKPKEANKSKAK